MKDVVVNAEFYKELMTERVLPAVKAHFGSDFNRKVIIQEDGAGGHGMKTLAHSSMVAEFESH
eukprot:scaffold434_cov186-Pinguiococcus_pyrenoidosus.AAC.161